MIRKTTTLLTVGFLTLAGFSAMAAPAHRARHAKASLAVATEGAAPAEKSEKAEKVEKKAKSTKGGASKDKGTATEGTTTTPPAPAGEKMPEKK
jgi:hypothetical protein